MPKLKPMICIPFHDNQSQTQFCEYWKNDEKGWWNWLIKNFD